jgi:hypothetical protein
MAHALAPLRTLPGCGGGAVAVAGQRQLRNEQGSGSDEPAPEATSRSADPGATTSGSWNAIANRETPVVSERG